MARAQPHEHPPRTRKPAPLPGELAIVFLLALFGCASPSREEGLEVRLRLPRALRHPPERTERFLRRVDRLVVRVSSSSEVREYAFPLHGDRRFFLPLRGEGEREIAVQIWDRTRDGKPRRFPALTGRGRLTSDRRVTQVELDLNVPVSEY